MTNTLELKLAELNTLVEYGCYGLSLAGRKDQTSTLLEELDIDATLDKFFPKDIADYMVYNGNQSAMLDAMHTNDILRHIRYEVSASDIVDNFDEDEILDNISEYTLKQHVKDNFDADDIFDEDDMLDCLSADTILDYLANTHESAILDWVKDNCDASDLVKVSNYDVEWE